MPRRGSLEIAVAVKHGWCGRQGRRCGAVGALTPPPLSLLLQSPPARVGRARVPLLDLLQVRDGAGEHGVAAFAAKQHRRRGLVVDAETRDGDGPRGELEHVEPEGRVGIDTAPVLCFFAGSFHLVPVTNVPTAGAVHFGQTFLQQQGMLFQLGPRQPLQGAQRQHVTRGSCFFFGIGSRWIRTGRFFVVVGTCFALPLHPRRDAALLFVAGGRVIRNPRRQPLHAAADATVGHAPAATVQLRLLLLLGCLGPFFPTATLLRLQP